LSFPFFSHDRPLYFLSGLIILIGFTSIDWYFSGIENFKLIAVRSVVVKLISLIGLFAFVKFKSDYNIYLIISIFSILGNNLINIFAVRKYFKFSLNGIKKHLKPLMYTFGTTIATSMYTILDTVLIGFFADEKSVGLYSASVKLTKISIPFILSSGTVLMPRISKLFGSEDFDSLNIVLNKSFSFIVIVATPVCLGLLMLAPQLIYVFSGPQFNDAILTMQILSPLTLIIGLGNFWGFQILFSAGKEREMLISVVIGMVVNLTLNIILIPIYKQNGAAVANVVSELMVTGSFMFFCLKIIKFKVSHQSLINNILASLPLIFVVLLFKMVTTNIYYQLFLSVFSFIALYFLIQVKLLKNSIVNELIFDYLKRR
jgi:O-antigen/teichoic acid export membrane protein